MQSKPLANIEISINTETGFAKWKEGRRKPTYEYVRIEIRLKVNGVAFSPVGNYAPDFSNWIQFKRRYPESKWIGNGSFRSFQSLASKLNIIKEAREALERAGLLQEFRDGISEE